MFERVFDEKSDAEEQGEAAEPGKKFCAQELLPVDRGFAGRRRDVDGTRGRDRCRRRREQGRRRRNFRRFGGSGEGGSSCGRNGRGQRRSAGFRRDCGRRDRDRRRPDRNGGRGGNGLGDWRHGRRHQRGRGGDGALGQLEAQLLYFRGEEAEPVLQGIVVGPLAADLDNRPDGQDDQDRDEVNKQQDDECFHVGRSRSSTDPPPAAWQASRRVWLAASARPREIGA